jgi:DNA repair protein RecN (Recombination protein N)
VSQLDEKDLDDHLFDGKGAAVTPGSVLKGEFLISTNVGQKPLPLARVASGGELSRIMLAIKVQQRTSHQGTLIFDEIDSGISGQTALMIAKKLKELSSHAQSIVVTHLHQVASVADTHFVISKKVTKGATSSSIREVARMDRVNELARMMGGESPSQAVIKHAKELVGM